MLNFIVLLDECAEALGPWPLIILVLFALIYGGTRLAHWHGVVKHARQHEQLLRRMGIK